MEGAENILEAIHEEDNVEDIDMMDVEEGEFVESGPLMDLPRMNVEEVKLQNQESLSQNKNRKRRANKKKNKKRKNGSRPDVTNIHRLVSDTCRRLREKKSYMVYTAAGCLGVSALSDLIKEVDAIQSCGGQMTADGRRMRTGGGILWSLIKAREPNAYKEIMKKAKEFEKQFKQQCVMPTAAKKPEGSSSGVVHETTVMTSSSSADGSRPTAQIEDQHRKCNGVNERASVHERIRVPVSYDDDLLADEPDGDST